MEKISWADSVKNESIARNQGRKEYPAIKKKKKKEGDLISHILLNNCLKKSVIEGKMEGRIDVTRGRERRRKQLLDDIKEKRGYWILKEEALYGTHGGNRF